jgi:chloramphenicol 3-O phosphotransferase
VIVNHESPSIAAASAVAGRIIFIHGASSAGKTTLCRELQARLDEPFWHYSIDHFRDTGVLPPARGARGAFAWSRQRPAFIDGFHRCLPALALAGNNLLVEHIIETREWMSSLLRLLAPIDVFFVGLRCPVEVLEARERARGDRREGEARNDAAIVHTFGAYDLEIDSTLAAGANARRVIDAWTARTRPAAFERMRAAAPADFPDAG